MHVRGLLGCGAGRPEAVDTDIGAGASELYLSGVQHACAFVQVTNAIAEVAAIAVEPPSLSVVTSTLELSEATCELPPRAIEPSATTSSAGAQSFAGAGLREGPAPAGIHPEIPDATALLTRALVDRAARAVLGGHRTPVVIARSSVEQRTVTATFAVSKTSMPNAARAADRCITLRNAFASRGALPALAAPRVCESIGARVHTSVRTVGARRCVDRRAYLARVDRPARVQCPAPAAEFALMSGAVDTPLELLSTLLERAADT